MVSIDDSPSLGTSLTLASYTCFSSTLKSFGRDMFSSVDIQRKKWNKKICGRSDQKCREGDPQHYNFPDHCTIPEFLGPSNGAIFGSDIVLGTGSR
jgi:hypothetical protein